MCFERIENFSCRKLIEINDGWKANEITSEYEVYVRIRNLRFVFAQSLTGGLETAL